MFAFLFISFLSYQYSAHAQETLNNQSIIDLVEFGFEDNVIKSKINASDVDFETDIPSLKYLKKKGVSSDIISLMLDKSKSRKKHNQGFITCRMGKNIKLNLMFFQALKRLQLLMN